MCDGKCCNQKDVQFLVLRKDCHGDFWVHSLCESEDKALEYASELVNRRLADRACVMRVLPKASTFELAVKRDLEHINQQLERFKA